MSFPSLASLGWSDALTEQYADLPGDLVPGRVARVDRGAVDVLTADGHRRCRTGVDDVTVGDWVAVADDPVAGTTVSHVLPRRTAVVRAAASGRSAGQVLAANLDVVLVVVPAVPPPRTGMVERLVALAWDSGAEPHVVVTKADLAADLGDVLADVAASAPGVPVLPVATPTGDGVDAVRDLLHGRTAGLLGRSGAGKSTLVNALAGEPLLAVQDVRGDGKGRHTTTHRQLVVLPDGGGVIVDTPGLRGVGIWLDGDGLDRAFADVEELALSCRFSDCGHATEPGCAVLGGIDAGLLDERRLLSWRKLQREATWIASRTDARLRAEQRDVWKALTREARGRIRP